MTEATQSFPNGNEIEIVRSEQDLITTVHQCLKVIDHAAVIAGKALRELKKAKAHLSQKEWDKFLRAEFATTLTTAHKWMDLAGFDDEVGEDDSFPIGNTVWENMPPRWTSQYNIISKLNAAEVVGALLTERITPLSTGKQIAEVIGDIRGEPVISPPAETYLGRALNALLDARTQHKAGNSYKKDHDETDLKHALSRVGEEFRRMVSAVQEEDEAEEDDIPGWEKEQDATTAVRAPKRDLGAEWHAEVRRCYEEADTALNGYLVNNKSRGTDARSLFTGSKSRAMKHASDELKEWWLTHPRPMSRADFFKANQEKVNR